ncbi:MAG: response regulator [Chitinophagaceae bacterium]|nr:MAG: response regulator [Chitinophagaceae bacterium]
MGDTFSYRIFLIDDDVDLLMLLERVLAAAGYVVETAASIEEAEDLRHRFAPHLYLIDINVRGEDGRRLCWKIKMQEGTPYVKVLLHTGYDWNSGRGALFGADEVLAKPAPSEYLLLRMRYHLKRMELERARGTGLDLPASN